ncbi:SusC/RagA family TonB-linked outer membrane protein [Sphingobacterium hungaricum]|uniref:SusC/RagA family TonB-linked outer membrane protein n=1 Tax=Sphingobacterium hungaricum TaxID=2082723 RepID=A0A928V0I9_9SPHI|nr:SusC/RagA family TonB-linked outer membrane protein [Sphingobacterium hungaricum]MBE8714257.1 SusC/RagA family TonB-linked outer membrane protein [Sphingobacterium hungaricum]
MLKNLLSKVKWRRLPNGFLLLFLLAFLFFENNLYGNVSEKVNDSAIQQKIKIKGKIVDSTTKLALSSVSVLENGRSLGSTDNSGLFEIEVTSGATISFQLIGYTTKTQSFTTPQNNVTIELEETSSEISEVVVTALGIKREVRALGYAATEIKGEQLTDAVSNNWTDALSGKVAGVNLVRSGGGPAGSNKIILRGENNLTGVNDALIVVDGIIINGGSGRMTGNGSGAYLASDSPTDFGSGLNDINPEDILSLNVLKGPNATALYGERGANGAIIITTKSGASKKGVGVTFTSNTTIEQISRWPDYQNEYGQGVEGATYYSFNAGVDGASTRSTSSAWGPKFDGQSFFQYDPITQTRGTERTPWVPYPDARKEFFDTGRTFTNSLTLDGGNETTTMRFSYTNLNNKWIIPNTGYDRNTVAINAAHQFTDKLKVQTRINYKQNHSDNLPSTGYNNQSLMYWNIFWLPNAPLNWLDNYWLNGQEGVAQSYPFSSFPDNPYLITNEMLNKSNRKGITGNVEATYTFSNELNMMVRTNLDFSNERRSQQRPYDTEKYRKGMYRTQSINSQEQSTDVMINYNKELNRDIKFGVSVGASTLKNDYYQERNAADSLSFPGIYTIANAAGIVITTPQTARYRMNSIYALGTFSYKDFAYFDFSARNDWNSTLATPNSKGNSSFFYPGANVSLILSEIVKFPQAISYVKLRSSIAAVGSGSTTPYQTSYVYNSEPTFPGGSSNPTQVPNLTLKPLRTRSFEVGTDLKFVRNRYSLGFTYYKMNTYEQHLSAILDRSSGSSTAIINAGEIENSGIEIEAFANPIKTKSDFVWNINGTFSANKNKILELTEDQPFMTLQNGPGSRGAIMAYVGGTMGDLYGRGYNRSPQGDIIYNNGLPTLTDSLMYIGNTNPTWRASINNQFSYKQFRISFLFDAQIGAVGYSLTAATLAEQGKTKNTLPGRYNGIIGNGVIQNTDGSFRPNDVIAENIWDYYNAHLGRDNVEGTSYSTDFLKLREARIDFNLNAKQLSRFGINRATIGVFGRDLYTWTKWPGFDPEFGTLGNGDINKGFELGQFPATRTFGFNLVIGI